MQLQISQLRNLEMTSDGGSWLPPPQRPQRAAPPSEARRAAELLGPRLDGPEPFGSPSSIRSLVLGLDQCIDCWTCSFMPSHCLQLMAMPLCLHLSYRARLAGSHKFSFASYLATNIFSVIFEYNIQVASSYRINMANLSTYLVFIKIDCLIMSSALKWFSCCCN